MEKLHRLPEEVEASLPALMRSMVAMGVMAEQPAEERRRD